MFTAEAVESFDVIERGQLDATGMPMHTKKVRLYNKLQAIMRLVDIGMGVYGKPTN